MLLSSRNLHHKIRSERNGYYYYKHYLKKIRNVYFQVESFQSKFFFFVRTEQTRNIYHMAKYERSCKQNFIDLRRARLRVNELQTRLTLTSVLGPFGVHLLTSCVLMHYFGSLEFPVTCDTYFIL